ncbi:MAG: S1C family serine protease [Candidatus Nanoarchaeia archaeon]
MDNPTTYFLISLILIAALGGGGYYYHVETINALNSDYNARFVDVNERLGAQSDNLQELNTVVAKQGIELHSKITSVEEEQKAELREITGELARAEMESSGKIAGLEQELLQIDVETKGFASVIEKVRDSVVSLRTDLGYGSAVVISTDGYVLTNYHVAEGIKALGIVFSNGKVYKGYIAGFDKSADLALLKIGSESKFKPLDFERYKNLVVGQKVIAMGSPSGLDFTVTEGIISALDRKNPRGFSMVQTSVPINPGNSGGPLIDGNGRIVGINTYKVSGAEGLGFALNPDDANEFASKTLRADRDRVEEAKNAE